jgi:PAS domain S-box-containing protein
VLFIVTTLKNQSKVIPKALKKQIVKGSFGLALLLLCIFGIASYLSRQQLIDNQKRVEQTHQVLDKFDKLFHSLETSAQERSNYIITKGRMDLKDYQIALQQVKTSLQILRQLTVDNPHQQIWLNEIEPLIQQKLALLNKSIDLFQHNPTDQVTQISLYHQNKKLRDKIQAILAAMHDEEQHLLLQRSQAANTSTFYTTLLLGVSYCFSFILLISVYWLLIREIRYRQQVEESLRHNNEQLETKVEQRTMDLSKTNASLTQEIHERHQAEQTIREQAALLEIATDAIFVQDLEHRLVFWNKGAENLYGWTAQEILHKNVKEILYHTNSPQLEDALKTVLQAAHWQGELQQLTKNGKNITVASRFNLVHDQQGHPKSILVVSTDITNKKQAERQLLHAQRLESLGTLASGIAHDLNNVLTPILAAAQLLQMKFVTCDDNAKQLLTILESSAKRGADLVKQILSFGRGMEGSRTHIQLRHLLSDVIQVAQRTLSKSIEVQADLAPDLWNVHADATQLHQVFMNLIVNARDAMPDGGLLQISAQNLLIDESYAHMHAEAQVGPYSVVTIADTGIGISPEIIDRIFDPFFTTKELDQGTGLGLSTAVGIIKNHGGFLSVQSEVGKGTQFTVYLPSRDGQQTEAVEDLQLPDGRGELILVVDDEVTIPNITQTTLESHNYRVLTANNGIEALSVYAQHKNEISLVLIDLMMPKMDGATTILTLQRLNPEVKIIAMSGLMSHKISSQIRHLDIQKFLPKPFTTQTLLTTLHNILSPSAA